MRIYSVFFLLLIAALLQFNITAAQKAADQWRVTKKIRTETNGQKFTNEYSYSSDGRIQTVKYLLASGATNITIDNFTFARDNKPSAYVVTYNREGVQIKVSLRYDNSGRITELVKTISPSDITTFTYRYAGNTVIVTQQKTTGESNFKDNRITLYTEHGDYEETISDAATQVITSTITKKINRDPSLEPYPDNFMGGFEAPMFLGVTAYGSEPQITATKDSEGHITSLTFVARNSNRKNEYTYSKIGAAITEPVETGNKIIITTNINCTDGKLIIERILKSQEGVKSAVVDINTGKLSLDYSPDGTPYTEIIKQINDAGFDAERSISPVPDSNPCKTTTTNQFNIVNLKKIYQLREVSATPELKRRLTQQRSMIARNGFKYQVANTGVSENKLKDITGFAKISRSEILRFRDLDRNKPYNPEVPEFLKNYKPAADASLQQFDSRNYIKIPEVRTQKCASCWVYGAVGLLEISYMAQKGFSTTSTVDISEKQVLGCSGGGDCDGGWHFKTYEWMKNNNQKLLPEEYLSDDDIFAKKSTAANAEFVDVVCNVAQLKSGFVQLSDWGIVQKDKDMDKVADEYDIKEAVVKYGAVAVSIYASPVFQSYASSETFEETEIAYKDSAINHVVIIIGWDNKKQAWLIRNSWGKNWGDDGYGWIKFTTNHIGKHAIWSVAKIPTPIRIPGPANENLTPVTLTGTMLPGHHFPTGSRLTSPNGIYEFINYNNSIRFTATFPDGSSSSTHIKPFKDYKSVYKLYSNLPLLGSSAKSPFYLQDMQGNLFMPFGDKPFGKMIITDSGNVIACDTNENVIWSLNPVAPKIRRK